MTAESEACAVAHGETPASAAGRAPAADTAAAAGRAPAADRAAAPQNSAEANGSAERALVAVFASPVSGYLLRYATDAGYRGLLVEPDADRAAGAKMAGFTVVDAMPEALEGADVVVTDHHREELGVMLRDALATKARWVGIMGNPHHEGPHVAALESLGTAPGDIARVHRPIGLNIGSRTPPEIAISTLAGLIADRNSRPGGFSF